MDPSYGNGRQSYNRVINLKQILRQLNSLETFKTQIRIKKYFPNLHNRTLNSPTHTEIRHLSCEICAWRQAIDHGCLSKYLKLQFILISQFVLICLLNTSTANLLNYTYCLTRLDSCYSSNKSYSMSVVSLPL